MHRVLEILCVEDNSADQVLIREAVRLCGSPANIHVVDDGEKALAFLRREGDFQSAPQADLVLLDLNIPKKDGRAVLQQIKTHRLLESAPVFVFTTSESRQEKIAALELGAEDYVVKPMEILSFLDVMKHIVACALARAGAGACAG